MTYTETMTMAQEPGRHLSGPMTTKDRTMQNYVTFQEAIVRDRIRERAAEAAGERLAAASHTRTDGVTAAPTGLRRRVGRLLISAGRRVAGEPGSSGSSAARPASSAA